jgi:hypothetical protein
VVAPGCRSARNADYLLWSSARYLNRAGRRSANYGVCRSRNGPAPSGCCPGHVCRKPCEDLTRTANSLRRLWSLQQACRRFSLTGPSPGLSPQAVASGRWTIRALGDLLAGHAVVPAPRSWRGIVERGLLVGDFVDGLADYGWAEARRSRLRTWRAWTRSAASWRPAARCCSAARSGFVKVSTPEMIAAPRASMPAAIPRRTRRGTHDMAVRGRCGPSDF